MIEHIVMWKFREGTEREKEDFLNKLMALNGVIPEIKYMEIRRKPVLNNQTQPQTQAQQNQSQIQVQQNQTQTPSYPQSQIQAQQKFTQTQWDAMLISRFESVEALERYKNDERHKAVSALCKSIRVDRTSADFEI